MRERRPDPRRDFTCRWLRPNICTTRRKPARGNIVAGLLKDTHYRIETITAPPCVWTIIRACVCEQRCLVCSPRRLPLFLSFQTALVSKLIAGAQGSRWKIRAVHALTRIKDSMRCFLSFLSFFFLFFCFLRCCTKRGSRARQGGLKMALDCEWITLDEKWDGRIDDCCRFVFSILLWEYSTGV